MQLRETTVSAARGRKYAAAKRIRWKGLHPTLSCLEAGFVVSGNCSDFLDGEERCTPAHR